jgi:arylsulfatase A-like enzyme
MRATALALLLAPLLSSVLVAENRTRPNIVFILTDNQGAWTLGCYGNKDIRTPHIDRLASDGIRFTRALSSNPVCSPTRATFLTGLIPSQHGVHSFLDPKFMMGPQAYNTLAEFTTLPQVLQNEGYTCGLSGKWHLGANITPAPGFSFWVTKPDGSTKEFYNQPIIENGQITVIPEYTTEYFTRRGIDFIQANREKPFFLFLAYNGPYNLGPMMSKPARNRHAPTYKDQPFPSFPRDTMHPWQHANKSFHNTQTAIERCASETSGVDDGVGKILAELDRLQLSENTLVIYASDQGWMGGQNGLWGMGDHTRPIGAHELMMQIPFIFRHPKHIPSGQTSDALVSNYDFMPTLLGYLALPTATIPTSPGRDLTPILRKNALPADWQDEVAYEMENTRALRTERWKLIERHPNGPHEFYDMTADPQERFNLYNQPGYEHEQAAIRTRLHTFFKAHTSPKYDLWKNGISKASLQYTKH